VGVHELLSRFYLWWFVVSGGKIFAGTSDSALGDCPARGGRARYIFPRAVLVGWLLLAPLWTPQPAAAHPMGNFSINHFSALEVHPAFIRLSYVLDLAEIPTFQEMQDYQLTPQPDDPGVAAYRERKVRELQQGLWLQVGGRPLSLTARSSTVVFPPGAGGLPTLRFSALYEASLEVGNGQLVYEDRNYPQRAGWKEIVATAGDGVTLVASSVPAESRSNQLTAYAADLLQAPPQDLRASLSFTAAAPGHESPSTSQAKVLPPAAPRAPDTAQTPRSMLTELITARQLSAGVIVFSLLVAIGLGAFHALEPGHGKTLVAAYLVGSQGTAWHAVLLGLTVTASHTIGVYVLGGVALFASHYVLPEQLYPWLGFTSGLLITGMGVMMLAQAWQGHSGHHAHDSAHDHVHHHHAHPHDHGHDHTHSHHDHSHHHHLHPHEHRLPDDRREQTSVGYGALLTLGITGGMIPCPAALVVLLSAVALQRIAFGLLLIVAFSLGLAAVLVSAGLLLVSARGIVQRWRGEGSWLAYLPFLSPLVITPLGLIIAVRSLSGAGLIPGLPW
jgi:nickel/cobalt transporter (NicO) family protein